MDRKDIGCGWGKHKRTWSRQEMLTGRVTFGCEDCGFSDEVWVKPDNPYHVYGWAIPSRGSKGEAR
jgi:hypothetical protein